MGKTDELTVVQKTLGDSLNKEGKPLNVLAERAGCIKTFYAESRLKSVVWKRRKSITDDRSLERIF